MTHLKQYAVALSVMALVATSAPQLLAADKDEKKKLPQIELKTSKGTVVIELYEDEAPNTVANFVSLVEAKFYDGLTFHRVIDRFMAQGGCPKGDGTGGPGYKIACECYRKDHRMAHAGRDTGGSQFFITFAKKSYLDGKHTVFGHVIKGMDAIDKLNRSGRGLAVDKIITAKVLNKRDHKYVPVKVK